MKYYIPIYGWILAIGEWNQAVQSHKKALSEHRDAQQEFNLTCSTFTNMTKGFVATIGTLFLLMTILMAGRFAW